MAVKLTKRKGFNFFRSYYDVYNELESKEDKIAFIDALLNRQFLGIKPTNLKGMAKFAYISQTNSIDSQVKGYEDKTGIKLNPTEPPCKGGNEPPTEQVEEKEKVEEKGLNFIPKNQKDFQVEEIKDIDVIFEEVKKEKSSEEKEKDYSEDVFECMRNCLVYFPNDLHPTNEKDVDNWLDTIEKLNRLEHLQFSDIELLVKSARQDPFWSKNFLSITKLRRKDKDKVPYWKVFKEKFKINESKSFETLSAYDQALKEMNLK